MGLYLETFSSKLKLVSPNIDKDTHQINRNYQVKYLFTLVYPSQLLKTDWYFFFFEVMKFLSGFNNPLGK